MLNPLAASHNANPVSDTTDTATLPFHDSHRNVLGQLVTIRFGNNPTGITT